MKPLWAVAAFIIILIAGGCTTSKKGELSAGKEELRIRTIVSPSANLEVYADSVMLELLPIKDSYLCLYKGAHVVVVEYDIHPEDSIDTVWVKLAHNQEAQGWLRESELLHAFVPVSYISQGIYLFSRTYLPYFLLCLSLCLVFFSYRLYRRKQILLVYVNDIDSLYPLSLCLMMAVSATVYESIQHFAPELWQYYFFNPTLSPFDAAPPIALFLLCLWTLILLALATVDVVFRRLSASEAFFYLLGLLSACIFGFLFFVITIRYYVGYLFLLWVLVLFIKRARQIGGYDFLCGQCGSKLKSKGICPHCGARNE